MQLNAIQADIASLDAEIANETKSSAGDKFETSREMMSQSRERLSQGLAKIKGQLWQIESYQKQSDSNQVKAGTLVATQEQLFFFGMALGNVEIDGQRVKCLSLASPIGESFKGKKVGESFNFRDEQYQILYCH